jgi:chromosome segregation ATPase
MKPVFLCLCVLVVSFVVMPENVLGQTASTNASRPTSEQSLEELVREVRQLRATLQRINTAMYKGQVMLERLRLQQDQVARMTRDLADTRENLTEIRGHQARLKEMLTKSETGVESVPDPNVNWWG